MFKLTTGRGFLFAVACSVVVGAGCDNASEGQPGDASPALPKAAAPAESPLPPEMVAGVAANQGETPVALHFALKGAPKSGEPLDVNIVFVPRNALDGLSATFEATEGLVVVSGANLAEQQNVQPQKLVNHRITLMPSGDGVFIVTAIAQVNTADGTTASTFSFPVIVGGADRAPDAVGGGTAPAPGKP